MWHRCRSQRRLAKVPTQEEEIGTKEPKKRLVCARRCTVSSYKLPHSHGLMGAQSSRENSAARKQNAKIIETPTIILQRGLDILKKAVEEDKNQNYEEALRFYVQGVMYLLHVAKYNTESQQAKDRIKEKCAEYIVRVKNIKAYRNQIHGVGLIDNLETLSDSNVLSMVTEIICMCGDFMELKQPENEK